MSSIAVINYNAKATGSAQSPSKRVIESEVFSTVNIPRQEVCDAVTNVRGKMHQTTILQWPWRQHFIDSSIS